MDNNKYNSNLVSNTNKYSLQNNSFTQNFNADKAKINNLNVKNINNANTIEGNKITDGITILSCGTICNSKLIYSKKFTDGTITITNGTITGINNLDIEILEASTITDGTTTLSSGTLGGTSSIKIDSDLTIDTSPFVNVDTNGISLLNAPSGYPINDDNLIRKQDISALAAGLNVKSSSQCATTDDTFSFSTLIYDNTTDNGS